MKTGPNPMSGESMMGHLLDPQYRYAFLYLGIMPGILAMWTYYEGMEATSATVTTFVELLFPVGSIILNYFFLGAKLTPMQMVASLVLLFAVTRISMIQSGERLHGSSMEASPTP